MKKFTTTRITSFKDAFTGLAYILKTQKNAWIHSLATIMVAFMAWWLGCSGIEWAVLILTIGMVWIAEAFNTSIETAVDLSSPEIHPLARISKDVSAAAVLVSAIISVIVGLIILGPPLLAKLNYLFAQ
jgi:diacylglycerol kinase